MASVMKFMVLLCVVVAASANPISEHFLEEFASRDQTVIFGACQQNYKLLYKENVNVPSGFLQVKKKDVSFTGQNMILCIRVLDQLRNGKNANVVLNSGGVNNRYVVLNLKSGRGDPINYLVEIYGA